jgi:hypothetical protein
MSMLWQINRTTLMGLALIGATWVAYAADAPMSGEPAKKHDEMGAMHMSAAAKPASDAQLIASAETAAPKAIGRGATIVADNADGTMRTLRKGSNAYTCMPDSPETPGPDPMCWDTAAGAWVDAWLKHAPPPAGHTGLMYMLAGGTDASNTDPYAPKPAPGNHWIETGPHIMIVGADAAFYDGYPKGADPDTSQPYVMWAGTPYQHLMAPVK